MTLHYILEALNCRNTFILQILLNLIGKFFDYLGSIVSYLAVAVPILGGKFGPDEEVSPIISAVSYQIDIHFTLQVMDQCECCESVEVFIQYCCE